MDLVPVSILCVDDAKFFTVWKRVFIFHQQACSTPRFQQWQNLKTEMSEWLNNWIHLSLLPHVKKREREREREKKKKKRRKRKEKGKMHGVESIHNHALIHNNWFACDTQLAHNTNDAWHASYIINKLNRATQNNYNKMKTTSLTITTFSLAIIM